MLARTVWRLLLLLFASAPAAAQVSQVLIPAGTPEDQAIQEITKEADAAKQVVLWEEFVQKFSGNPMAAAYGHSQLAQQAMARGDNAAALEHGEKSLASLPNNMEMLVAQVTAAMALKVHEKTVKYAADGGRAYNGIGKGEPPAGMKPEHYAMRSEEEKRTHQPSYDFLESAAFNAITSEQDPKKRAAMIELYTPAFPGSKFEEQVTQYAIITLQQLRDKPRLIAYGEKALAINPESIPVLILLAETYSEDPKSAAKAADYARKAVAAAKGDDPGADAQRKLLAGSAHGVLGSVLLNQGNTQGAIVELRKAVDALGREPNALSVVLYRLGFAYAKLRRYTESREVLTRAAGIEGPAQQLARDLLVKVNAARAKGQ
jgi:tetratricopeptide (TPR) repeat protein